MFSKKKKGIIYLFKIEFIQIDLPKQNIKNIGKYKKLKNKYFNKYKGSPFGLQHNIHVDSNFNWTGKDPTSNFILENELGEGYFLKDIIF